ncbi:right-handed parallel beta-helix repeat-containing protein [Luteimonas sp. MC1895]|uniref:right-handed parallel beta-helix repeat-containing protein n=1 Tax=Luteimonas sp. MC1895 TaxID=2819513 RepID=UPI0018F06288|nr:right-handed parallel beta-helix repeat-containing protein [Luteimonas sp. MC1895]MBJ6978226.1 right-handed parallel beta-helix repeat-containing protein [Luteimonas sp. MC1895]
MHQLRAPIPDSIGASRAKGRRASVALAVLMFAAAAPVHAREWFVSTEGDDQGTGSLQRPFRTVGHVLGLAEGGDTITLRAPPGNRTYEECDLRLRVPLVLRSHPGERAHVHCAISKEDTVVVKVDPGGSGSRISNLELSGGSVYGVMLHSHWYQGAPASEHGARDVVLEDLLIRDTGRDGIKITPKSDNATIRRVEIRNTGTIYPPGTHVDDMNADGIDNVNGSGMRVEDSHIHDTATTGLYFKGGAADVLVQRNRIENAGTAGILVGFDTSPEYLDPEVNPAWHESVRAVVRNNVVRNTGYAGIGLYASKDALVANNTIIDAAREGHAALFFGIALQDWDDRAGRPPSVNPRIVNNLVVGGGRCIEIRQLSELGGLVGLDGAPGTDYNAYPEDCGFVDQRTVAGRLVPRRLAQWKLQAGTDAHSVSGGFRVDADGRLADGSAAPGPGIAVAGVVDDVTGASRSGDMVIGAYGTSGGMGAVAPLPAPPAPAAGVSDDARGAPAAVDVPEGAAALALAVLPRSPLAQAALALLFLALAGTAAMARLFQRRNMGVWLLSWLRQDWRAPVPEGTTRHLLFCFVDHYEPGWGAPGLARERARVARWRRDLPLLCARHRDADGRPPVHSFFFPGDEYRPEHLDALVELCRMGLGEIEVHLHHQDDTAATLRAKLAGFTEILASRHDALPRDPVSGQPRWAFIHGDWALDNSHPGGGHCGVDNELIVLREEGCYADFTFPAAPDPCQPRTINRIYRATDDPLRPKSHDTGERVRVGGHRDGDLMIIQGPLGLNWRSRKFGLLPRIENGDVRAVSRPLPARIDAWVRTGIHVEGRPEWTFVKVHTHGAEDCDMDTLLGPAMDEGFSHLESRYNDGTRWKLHYVSAREMYNIARAAEDGLAGDPDAWRDYEVPRPGYREQEAPSARTTPAAAAAVAS